MVPEIVPEMIWEGLTGNPTTWAWRVEDRLKARRHRTKGLIHEETRRRDGNTGVFMMET
jgi:hypothetical protein